MTMKGSSHVDRDGALPDFGQGLVVRTRFSGLKPRLRRAFDRAAARGLKLRKFVAQHGLRAFQPFCLRLLHLNLSAGTALARGSGFVEECFP